MKLNTDETQMLYNVLWAIGNNWITPEDILDDDYTPEDYHALVERINDETDLGWAHQCELTATCY